jgi:BMFP domain-containing protein YqiC
MEARRRLLDDLAKLATSAAGIVQGTGQEVEQLLRQRLERLLDSFDLVTREEFEVVKAMAETARRENEELAERLAALEASGKPAAKPPAARRPAARRRRAAASPRARPRKS